MGVRVIFMDEISARGLASTFNEAVQIASNGTAGFGISIDLDAVDPVAAPGVGSPIPGGLRGDDLIKCLTQVATNEGLLGIEVAELNLLRDSHSRTALLAPDLLHVSLKRFTASTGTTMTENR